MLQDLLAGVTDRVVVAITFLAMLELVKGRELTVEQAEPWGPIASGAGMAWRRGCTGVRRADEADDDRSTPRSRCDDHDEP